MFIREEKTLKVILIIVANISWFFFVWKNKEKRANNRFIGRRNSLCIELRYLFHWYRKYLHLHAMNDFCGIRVTFANI